MALLNDNDWIQLYLAGINAVQTIFLAVIAALSHARMQRIHALDSNVERNTQRLDDLES